MGVGSIVGGLNGLGDGTVSVAETMLPGASDYCQIPTGHMGMLFSSVVASELTMFLQRGSFSGRYAVPCANNS